jgi:hypothetical protein
MLEYSLSILVETLFYWFACLLLFNYVDSERIAGKLLFTISSRGSGGGFHC